MEMHCRQVSDLLDAAAGGAPVEASIRRRLYGTADFLRRAQAPAALCALAIRAACAVHRLEFAVGHSSPVDQDAARRELGAVRSEWRQAVAGRLTGGNPQLLKAA